MRSKLPIIVFIIVALVASAAVAFAVFFWQLVGAVISDSNFDTFHHISPEQGEGIIGTVHSIVGLYVVLLLVTNALWVAAACFLLSHVKRREDKSPNPHLEAIPAVVISGWRDGADKVSATRLLNRETQLGLVQSKMCIDRALDRIPTSIQVSDFRHAERLGASLDALGWIVSIERQSPNQPPDRRV